MKLLATSFAAAASLIVSASAQSAPWGQCGGTGYTGPITCTSGFVCTYSNPWFSQCIPGTATSTAVSSTTRTSSSTTLTTSVKTSTTTTRSSSTTTTSSVPPPSSTGIKYLISFGDSYTQTGFNPDLEVASPANPLGNPTFPGWTTSGGPNWIGYYITQFKSSPVYSYNYAYGGATTDGELVTPYAPGVLSFVDQVNQYLTSITKPGFKKWNGDNSLFAVWIGVNDVGNSWYSATYTTLLTRIMDQYFNQTQTLYDSGARNFLFLSVPPTNLSPTMLKEGTDVVNAMGAAIKQYNDALKSRVAAFQAKNPGVKTYLVDTNAPFVKAIDNPKAYGADNATCFDITTKCLWWDNYHPGTAIHRLVAEAVAAAIGKW